MTEDWLPQRPCPYVTQCETYSFNDRYETLIFLSSRIEQFSAPSRLRIPFIASRWYSFSPYPLQADYSP